MKKLSQRWVSSAFRIIGGELPRLLLPLLTARSSIKVRVGDALSILHPHHTGAVREMLWGDFGGFSCALPRRVTVAVVSVVVTRCVSPRAGEAALRGEPRMQPLPVSPALSNHRTGPPPISPSKRKLSMDQGDEELDCENDHVSKMSRMFNPHL